MNILLFEDDPGMSTCICDMLEARGRNVTALYGIKCFNREKIIGITPGGANVELSLADYDLAVVDGKLVGDYDGWDVVPHLVDEGVVCIAHSSEDAFNRRMKDQGAAYQALKVGTRALRTVIEEVEKTL
jgi:DNA-binding response OmpR family regulator